MQQKRMIFHLPFKPNPNHASASQIRPFKMIEAFKSIGYQVDVVIGKGKERKARIKQIRRNIKLGVKYSFLYSESSTLPTLLTEKHHIPTYPLLDFAFFALCKKNHIPIGLFYRDVYWLYPEYKNSIGTLKSLYTAIFYKLDLLLYNKFLKVVFLPSLIMAQKIPQLTVNKYALPSGATILKSPSDDSVVRDKSESLSFLYVGGIGELYDLQLFCEVIAELGPEVKLILCCREQEWAGVKSIYQKYLLKGNILVKHENGPGLLSLYASADIGCLFIKSNEYRRFAMPFKLFEYLGQRKPIIAPHGTAAGDFVKSNSVGWVVSYSKEDLTHTIKSIIADKKAIDRVKNKVEECIQKNTWEYRAREVEANLVNTK